MVGLVLAAPLILDRDYEVLAWVLAIAAYTTFRTFRPLDETLPTRDLTFLVLEAGLMAIGTVATDYYRSPVAFSVLTAVAVAGFASGFGLSLRIAIASSLAVGIPSLLGAPDVGDEARLMAQWTVELVLVAVVASYARRISGDADERHSLALDRLGRLADANTLLFSLHQVAQDLPASLDLGEVLDSTVQRLQDLVRCDSVVVLLHEDTDSTWRVARSHGARLHRQFNDAEIPEPISAAARVPEVVERPNLTRLGGPGVAPRSASGLYVALRARGSLVGAIALEHGESNHFEPRATEVLAGFAESAALALDNARWFGRLRTVGADEERMRIARDLHDRIGQSLAYVAFELDRIVRKHDDGELVATDLAGLRSDVRGVVSEVRDTLYDLRTDVSDDKTVPEVLTEFLARVEERSGLDVRLRVEETHRLARPQERELWRIAQEAIVNVERHAQASRLTVTWQATADGATVEVLDDGVGFPSGDSGRLDSYGLIGMRERAASIGASLQIKPGTTGGTRVLAVLRRPA